MLRRFAWAAACLAVACGGEDEGDGSEPAGADLGAGGGGTPDAAGPALPAGCDALVEPGENDLERLQTALIEVAAGATLGVDDVTVRGAGRDTTILDFSAQNVGANGLLVTSDRVTLEAFTVRETPGDGIRANDVAGIVFRDLAVTWAAESSLSNGAYGLYPVQSRDVLIERCLVVGARDAGIYVGQSERIVVRDSEARGNVAGIEIENSTDAEVVGNLAHDNTGGILVFNLPELPVQDGKRAKVHGNRVEANNRANFGAPGSIVSQVPSGTGILVLAADGNEIHDNTLTGNAGGAVMIVSFIPDLFGEYDDPAFNRFPTGNFVHDNTFDGNGEMPQGLLEALGVPAPFAELLWDGCVEEGVDGQAPEVRNCFRGNTGADFHNLDFCNGFAGRSTDAATVDCSHDALPPIDL